VLLDQHPLSVTEKGMLVVAHSGPLIDGQEYRHADQSHVK
jgi:hypothetical protein